MQEYENRFLEETGEDLYESSLRLWLVAWLSISNRTEWEAMLKLLPEWFKEWFNNLIEEVKHSKKGEWLFMRKAIEYSLSRSFIRCRRDSLTTMSEIMFNDEQIINSLLSLWVKWINPLILINSWEQVKKFRSVLRFTRETVRRYSFITPIYIGNSRKISYYEIDYDLMSKYTVIHIWRQDITWVDLKVYHPIIWDKIIKQDFNLLII